jgi:hypothetical protein
MIGVFVDTARGQGPVRVAHRRGDSGQPMQVGEIDFGEAAPGGSPSASVIQAAQAASSIVIIA